MTIGFNIPMRALSAKLLNQKVKSRLLKLIKLKAKKKKKYNKQEII